jgi:peptidoglycan/LPS O-acetylase OafA/YrhL
VEVMFYIALPAWALAVRRLVLGKGMRGLLGAELLPLGLVALGGIAVQLAAARDLIPRIVGVTLAGQCTWIVLGMAIAVLSVAAQHDDRLIRRLRALASRSELCWGVAIAAFIGLMPLQPSAGLAGLIAAAETRQSGWITLAKIGLPAVVAIGLVLPLVFGDQKRGLPRRLLTTAPVAWLGVISYSFYLWHLTVAQFIALGHSPGTFTATGIHLLAHVHTARTFVLYVVTLAITGLLATASYQLIELPFLKRKESHQSRR